MCQTLRPSASQCRFARKGGVPSVPTRRLLRTKSNSGAAGAARDRFRHRTRGSALGPERLASTRPDALRFHNASTAPFATCFPTAAIADVPRRKRSREDGRCPARTGDLLLVRREQVLRSAAVCRSDPLGERYAAPWLLRSAAVCRFHSASTCSLLLSRESASEAAGASRARVSSERAVVRWRAETPASYRGGTALPPHRTARESPFHLTTEGRLSRPRR